MFDYNLKRKIPKNDTILESDKFMFTDEEFGQDAEGDNLKVNYLRRPIPDKGPIACICAVVGTVLSIIAVVMLNNSPENPADIISVLVFCSLIWSVAATVTGVMGLFEKNRNYLISFISAGVGIAVLFAWIIILVMSN